MTNDKARTAMDQTAPPSRIGLARLKCFGVCAVSALAFLVSTGCSEKTSNTQAPEASETENASVAANSGRQVFQVRGVIQEVRPAEMEVVIKHEAIPNYMPAMTMALAVKSTNELSGLLPNDQITFQMVVTDSDGWVENIKKTGVAAIEENPKPTTRIVRDVDALEIGDKMPNYPLTNSLGEKLELKDFAGQAYAFTFIFTRCPFPTYCPRMNSNFETAYKELLKDPNAPTNWHLISISFDPEFDTPERLKQYAATYNPDPKKWSWVTGAMIDIDAITEQFGLYFARDKGTINHNLRTVVVDRNGVIRQILIGNEWEPETLADEIIAGAHGKPIGEH